MKLHLPKMLLTAVLAACSTAYAFGPQKEVEGVMTDVKYTEITDAISGAQSPTVDTWYKNGTSGQYSITGTGVHVKLSLANNNSNAENRLGTITAASTWIAGGRFSISGSELAGAGTIYVNGGALQLRDSLELENKVVIGTSTYSPSDGGWENAKYTNVKNAALLVGFWEKEGKTFTLSGGLDIAQDAKIVMQSGSTLNITGALTTDSKNPNNLNITGTKANAGSASVVTISGNTSGYTGNISLSCEDDYSLTLKLTGNGANLLTNAASITVGANSKLDLSAVESATLTDKITNNGSIIISKAIINNATKSVGSLEITSLDGFTKTSTGYVGATNKDNGFIYANDVQAIDKNSTGAISGVTVKLGNSTFTTDNEGMVDVTDYRTFFVKSGTEAVSTVKTNSTSANVEMSNGTTLTVDADIAAVRTAEGATTATLTVNNTTDTNPTITTLSAAGAEVTVGGTSGLSITNATASKLTANADINLGGKKHEVGALVINDGATVTSTYGNNDANASGFVKNSLTINGGGTFKHTGNGLSPFGAGSGKIGSITMGDTSGKTATMLLTNRTVLQGNTFVLKGNTLIGSASAEGAVTDAREDSANDAALRDKRAILDFIDSNTVTVSGTNNTINAALRLRNDSTTTFKVNNTTKDDVTTEGSVVLNGNIFKAGNNGSLTKSGDGKLTIASTSAVVHNANVTGGTLEIAKGKTLTATGTMTVGAGSTLALSSANAFAVTGTMTFNEGAKLSYTLGAIAAAETGDISYTLGTAGSFIGVDTLKYAGEMEGYTAKFSTVAGGNNTQSLVLTFEQNAITLTETQVTDVVGFDAGVLTLKTAVDANKYVFGDTFNVNISAELWETVIAAVAPGYANGFYITMRDKAGAEIDFGAATPTVVFNGQSGTVQSVTTTAGTYSVPEPTTATLSLLALAALAARRRRK